MDKDSFNTASKTKEDRSKQPPRFSIHLSWELRDRLEELAQGMPWATYIKEAVFSEHRKRAKVRLAEIDRKLIAKLLAVLGKSRIANNLNQLAKAANSGSLAVNIEVEKAILDACRAIQWMRITLMRALGINTPYPEEIKSQPDDPER